MMFSEQSSAVPSGGRREFLKSLFGLRVMTRPKAVGDLPEADHDFYWSDLRTGQIGFPTGMNVSRGLPGCLMELVAAAACLEEALVVPKHTFECEGQVVIGGHSYVCRSAHGKLTLPAAIAHSCSVTFAQLGERLTPECFVAYGRRFGLDCPVAGFPTGAFPLKPVEQSQAYVAGLSGDLQPQALQILRMTALIGLSGLVPPLHSADCPPGSMEGHFQLALSAGVWSTIAEGMRMAAGEGVCKEIDPEDRLQLAAKTSWLPQGQLWITGYFPWEAPRYAFCLRMPRVSSRAEVVARAQEHLFAESWPL